ncbi:hypothetical protein BB560_001170 [Smittium megazygosporum]|uniref:FIST domain-containing protein n=1 Tax=Smittium megazygosporum TaxID=133381 RepID=A0A2T9ZIC1_9FUNG|nr:hypothetical protein BB560_001170 [Smittium megazygosporum]
MFRLSPRTSSICAQTLRSPVPNTRNLWCATSSSNPVLSQAVAECSSQISKLVSSSSPRTIKSPSFSLKPTACFLVTSSYSPEELSSLPSYIISALCSGKDTFSKSNFSASENDHLQNPLSQNSQENNQASSLPINLIGVAVNQVSSSENLLVGKGLSLLYFNPLFESPSKCQLDHLIPVPFLFEPGPKRKEFSLQSVGRWYSSSSTMPYSKHIDSDPQSPSPFPNQADKQTSSFWDTFRSVSKARFDLPLPKSLEDIFLNKDVEIDFFLSVSDKDPQQVLELLDSKFPISKKNGSQTPFINGLEHTLYYQNSVLSKGTYGIAFLKDKTSESNNHFKTDFFVSYSNLKPVGTHTTISKARGNVILQVGNSSPINWFKSSIKSLDLENIYDTDKHGFYLALFENKLDQFPSAVIKINGADNSRDVLSVDSIHELPLNKKIQLMVYSENRFDVISQLPKSTENVYTPLIQFHSLKNEYQPQGQSKSQQNFSSSDQRAGRNLDTSENQSEQVFGGASEMGFFYGLQKDQGSACIPDTNSSTVSQPYLGNCSTICDIPNSKCTLSYTV